MSDATTDILLERFEVIACSHCKHPCDTASLEPFATFACPACGNRMRVPARFANFIVLEQLGKGGMGAVYRAYDETLGRAVALKVMQQSIGRDRDFVGQFLQEARALAAINHPNIVQIYNYGEENGQPYIVMELVDGDRLDHIHETKKSLDELFVLQIAIEVCRGMQAASAAGMTHGDIKPANILFDKAGHAKVSDFGLARLKGEKPKPGEIWGTPFYVAPEVVRREAPNAASDIYSLGGTLYHVLTGEPPFNGETVTDTVLLRFKEPAPDPRTFKPDVTPATAKILMRMLEADVLARYPNYNSLLNDLQQAYDALKLARSGKKPEKKFPWGAVIGGTIVLAALAVGGVLGKSALDEHHRKAEADRQFELDKREGRLKQVLRGGQLVWVKVDPAAKEKAPAKGGPADAYGAAPAADAPAAKGPVSFAASADVTIRPAGSNAARDKEVLVVCAGNGEKSSPAKIYLQFKLPDRLPPTLKSAALRLTCKATTKKARDPAQRLRLWALRDDSPLPLVPTDEAAPATIP
ncbi:MAG: serine/threonine protein kinase, partial [Kiritimatiellae bacterium]|nr:serine/threonine protein kinase [Kiritimatiellia bacterium]